ncbi:MAG: hypothetical protein H6706_05475 [Myxococcales bacterium]|nr:hypothetical protein [Myxococcales bacterium]
MAQVLAAGADPDGRGPGDLTAAFLAAARGARSDLPRAIGVIEALRAAGADLDVVCTADPTGQHSGKTARQILNELGVLPGWLRPRRR